MLSALNIHLAFHFFRWTKVLLTAQPVDFLHDLLPNGITVNTCTFCNLIVGAGQNIAVVEMVEQIHECLWKREFYFGSEA